MSYITCIKVITNKSGCERNMRLMNGTISTTIQRISIPSSSMDLLWRKSAEESFKFLSPADTTCSPYRGEPCLASPSPFRRRAALSLASVVTCTGPEPEFGPAVPVPTQATPSDRPQTGGDAGVGDPSPRCLGVHETGQPSPASTSYMNFNRGILTLSH